MFLIKNKSKQCVAGTLVLYWYIKLKKWWLDPNEIICLFYFLINLNESCWKNTFAVSNYPISIEHFKHEHVHEFTEVSCKYLCLNLVQSITFYMINIHTLFKITFQCSNKELASTYICRKEHINLRIKASQDKNFLEWPLFAGLTNGQFQNLCFIKPIVKLFRQKHKPKHFTIRLNQNVLIWY